jgi:hypothetical protein
MVNRVFPALSLFAALLLLACKSGSSGPVAKRYAVSIDPASPSTVRVRPEGGWKLNLKYENSLEARAKPAGTEVKLGHADAKVNENELTFTVPVQPRQSYEGTVSFAICDPGHCIPISETISWTVAAK